MPAISKETIKEMNRKSMNGELSDEENFLFTFSMTSSKILNDIISGKIDPVALAKYSLECRR